MTTIKAAGYFITNPKTLIYKDGPIPDFPPDVLNYDYLKDVKRENTSEIVFPNMATGDLIIYNFTLYHAIAPIEEGTRYSLVFFYDMNHPDVSWLKQRDVEIRIENHYERPVDVYHRDFGNERDLVIEDLEVGEGCYFFAINSHSYVVVDPETGKELKFFDVFEKEIPNGDDDIADEGRA